MTTLIIASFALLLVLTLIGSWAASQRMYNSGDPLGLGEMSPRMLDALAAEVEPELNGTVRPNEAFWAQVEQGGHPLLDAALDFDERIPDEQRAAYDGFWEALRQQDDAFWHALNHGDNRPWAQLEREHGVQVPVAVAVGGGS